VQKKKERAKLEKRREVIPSESESEEEESEIAPAWLLFLNDNDGHYEDSSESESEESAGPGDFYDLLGNAFGGLESDDEEESSTS